MNTDLPEERRSRNQDLRRRAEDMLVGKPVDLADLPPEDIQYLLHELQVHQAELAIQNEDLRRVQLDLEVSRDLFSDLYNFAPSGYCTLSQKGRILNANLTLAELLEIDQEDLLHRPLSDFVDGDFQDTYYLHCQRVLASQHREESEIQMVKPTGERLTVRIESIIARGDHTQLMVTIDDLTEQRRLEKQQQENATQMVLQRRLIEHSEMERLELARNLHDGPIQRLAGLGLSIQILKDILKEHGVHEEAYLEQLGEDIKNLLVELRGISNDLRPPVLSRFGLSRALKDNIDEFNTRHPQIKVSLELNELPESLPDPVALAFYRIYQSAMSNILQHSNASDVKVRLFLEPQQILFEIQDNGKGLPEKIDFDEYARQGHLGLVGMKERSEAIGGRIELFSTQGGGMMVRVVVPRMGIAH